MQALESESPSPCKTPDIFIDSTAQTINQEKMKNPGMRSNFQQIASYCLGLHTQNPELREAELEPSPKRGSLSCWKKEETPKRKQVVSYSLDSHMDPR